MTTCFSFAVCFFLPCRVTSLTLLRLTASGASLIDRLFLDSYRRARGLRMRVVVASQAAGICCP